LHATKTCGWGGLTMNIAEPIFVQCRNKPSELALCAPGTEFNLVSYARLERSVNNICRRIIAAGIAPRSRIAVTIDDPIFHAMIVVALTRLGVIAISGSQKDHSSPGEYLPIKRDGVIADRSNITPGGEHVVADLSWADGDGQALAEKHRYRAAPDEVCCIFITSGADGRDNAIAMTNRMMATRVDRQNLFFGPQASFCARTCLDLPLTTPLGFQVLLATLWRGGALLMTWGAPKTIAALPAYKIQNIVGAPDNVLKLVGMIEGKTGYQGALQAVFSAGIIGSQAACDRVRAGLCSHLTMGYMSEDATMVTSMPVQFASGTAGEAGYILPGIAAEIVDEEDRTLSAGQEGILRIRSDHGAREYLENVDETQRAFRDGWFYNRGRFSVRSDNMLVISGWAGNVRS
jgi:acyl-coenzyme A synthetase/AMP-(fatty) acid ligase